MYCTVDWHDEGVDGMNNLVWQSLKQDGSGLNTTTENKQIDSLPQFYLVVSWNISFFDGFKCGPQRLHFVFFGL
jgi:hypothetical protein